MSAGRTNIILIQVDQMRYDTPGYAGSSPCMTPNLDTLAAQGCIFTQARTPCSLCSPARASMFTGDYAFTHGMGTNCDMYQVLSAELNAPDRLLHYRLQEEKYRCGYVGKWHVGKDKGPGSYGFEGMDIPGYGDIIHDRGFLRYLQTQDLDYTITDCIYGNENQQTLLAGCWKGSTASTPSHYLADQTISMLKEYAAGEEPFFLTCQFWGPHMPHLPSEEYYQIHNRQEIQEWLNAKDDWEGKPGIVRRLGTDFYRTAPASQEEWAELIGCYYDFTAMIDGEIGRILDTIKALGLSSNSLICFTTDHGDMTGSHGGLLDKGFLYEEAHRIPMVMAGPGIPSGSVCGELVMNMDLFPTFLDYVGIGHESRDGRSFMRWITGGEIPEAFRDQVYMEFHGLRFLYSQRAIVTASGWKYIFTPGDTDELYDLNDDPGELRNRIMDSSCEAERKQLQEQLLREAQLYHDPLASCIAKLFGRWDIGDNQPNPTRL